MPSFHNVHLHHLCESLHADLQKIVNFLKVDWVLPTLNVPDEQGNTALHKAVRNSNHALVKVLIGHGAHPDLPNHQGETPLHWTAWYGDTRSRWSLKTVAVLLNNMADPHRPNAKGQTPWLIAERVSPHVWARMQNVRNPSYRLRAFMKRPNASVQVQRCLDLGASPDARTWGGTPCLILAVDARRLEHAQTLLAAGAKTQACTAHGDQALHHAVCRFPDAMLPLLNAGAEVDGVNARGRSALWMAVHRGNHAHWCLLLAEHGANPLLNDEEGISPWAEMFRQIEKDPLYDGETMRGTMQPLVQAYEHQMLNAVLPLPSQPLVAAAARVRL